MTDPVPGILTTTDGHTTWASAGVRIEAAADLTETREYADLPEAARLVKAVGAEAAWLAGQWDDGFGARLELRYLSSGGRLTCVLLGRVHGAGHPDAVPAAAAALRQRLAATLPRHVHAAELTDAGELHRCLVPFTPAPGGIADIRKRIHAAVPQRPDAGVAFYLAVEPFTASAPSWEPLWQALAGHPYPVLLSVGLEPYRVPPAVAHGLHRLATDYGRLATPGRTPDGLFNAGRNLAADTFAVDAARLYADAARRYADRAYRLRVTLASPAPLPDALLELAGATVSPPQRAHDDGALTSTFHGPAHVVVRPEPHEATTAWRNVTTLDLTPWDARYTGSLPVTTPQVVRLVGDRAAGPLGVALGDLTRHALFVGTTGSGKTNSVLAFCEQLWTGHRIPFLVLEPVNTRLDDYRWLATRPGMEDLVVLTVGNESVAPFRLNPFEVPPGVRVGAHIAGLLACFDAAFGLWDPLPSIYNRALRDTYAKRGIVPADVAGPQHAGNWPTLADFTARMRERTAALDYAGEVRSNIIAASLLRAESLAEGACGSTVDCSTSYPLEILLSRPVVVELAEVGDNEKEQSLLTALILQAMTSFYKAGRESGELAHVTVIEEAHRLLGRPPLVDSREGNAQARAASAFANTLAENRKYGEGVVIVEQVPGKLVEDAYKNTNLKVMHRLPAADDRHLIGATMRFSDDQERYAATLAPFTAFAYHDRIDRPALLRVPDVRGLAARAAGQERAPRASDGDLAARFRALASASAPLDAAIAPYVDCEGCAHRCLFRSRAATAVRPEHVAALKRRVEGYPKEAAARPAWWSSTGEWVRSVADGVPLHGASPEARRDYEACVFVHVARRSWRQGTLPWIRLYRRHVPDAAQAPPR